MYRMFRMASQLRTVSQAVNTPVLRLTHPPLLSSVRFYATKEPSSALEQALRMAVQSNADAILIAKFAVAYRRSQGDNFLKREVKLSEQELLATDLVIDKIREKYGIRRLTADDSWETIDVVTDPEQSIRDEVKKGKSLEEAMITTMKHMAPKVSCSNIDDLVKMISIQNPAPSEINGQSKEVVNTDASMKPN